MQEPGMTESTKKNNTVRHDKYIVAVGASAGGLEAIHQFFDHMPVNASFSFVVIQHLSSDYKSLLVELVGKHTHMKVFEAANDMAVQQDCVYIIPNNKLMTISRGRLKLSEKSAVKAPNTAIDHFLFTLAKDKKDKAIAIILSGTGTDGTKGIHAIKEFGGMVIVQEPSTAKFDGMPNSAIASGCADHILAPSIMHKELFQYVNEEPIKVLEDGKIDEKLLDEIFTLVHQQSGNDFNLYKTPTIIRRIGRRMNESGIKTLPEYVKFLHDEQKEVAILSQDFLIGVTKFFRDKAAFEVFAEQLSTIIESKSSGDTLKIWVCACSTGQEAYTVAVLAHHVVAKSGKSIEIKIFATDIDEKSIEIAARNQFPDNIKKEIPAAYFKKYFAQDGKFYGVLPEIRKSVVFAKHDVIKSPPFIKNDIVTCRNMLIYVNSVLQEKILSIFHFSLVQGGTLFLGSSETISTLKEGFTDLNTKWKFYKKSGIINYASYNTYNSGGRSLIDKDKKKPNVTEVAMSPIEKSFSSFLTRDLGYAGIYIDKSYLMQDAIGDYRKYLSLPEEKIELNILKMVPKDVSIILNTALRTAWKDNKIAHLKRVRFQLGKVETYLNISVKPPDQENGVGFTLIIFGESTLEIIPEKHNHGMIEIMDGNEHEYIFELEAELNETRSNLQLAVEEMETTNEELQSTNEEMLSANEELQSSNEELQSLNEELHTLNTEHQLKIKELIDLNDDLDNYFRSTDIGQIFIDKGLYIRKFNVAAIAMVNLIEADIGRSISQISNNIQVDNLNDDIEQVLNTGKVIEKEVQIRNGKPSLMKIMPYLRKDRRNDGIVITFVDISKLTELSNIISGVFNASLNGVLAFKACRNKQHFITDFECISSNDAAKRILKKESTALDSVKLQDSLPELADRSLMEKYISVVEKGTQLQTEFKLDDKTWVELVAVKMSDGFAATITDITKQKLSEEKLKRNFNELLGTRENLKNLNSELEIKVKERTQRLSESENRFNLVSQATNDTIWDWNLADNTMWRSANFSTIFGYDSIADNNNVGFYFNIIHPDDRKAVKKSVYDAINNGDTQWTAQYRLLKGDGEYATILDRGSIFTDENNVPYRMVGSMLDVSVHIDTESRLSSTERRFRKIFDSNVIGMIFSNIKTGRIENANHIFLDMLGYTVEEFEQGEINWQAITPQAFMPISIAAAELLRTEGFCEPFEKQYYHKDGHAVDVLVGSAILDDENLMDAVTYVIDISKQKENEKRRAELQGMIKKQQDEFYSIFKKAPALISIKRGEGLHYEFVNEAFMQFDGGTDYIGKAASPRGSKLQSDELQAYEKKVMQTGEALVASSYKLSITEEQTGKEKDCWFDIIINPVYSAEGYIDGVSFFGFEVTDLMIAQRATKELMHKKDEFMSIASHELKTPLTTIKGYLQFALRMAEQEKWGQIFGFVDKANKQLCKLTSLVDDLLDVTKIQAGKMTFNNTTFNVREIIDESLDGIRGNLDGQSIVYDVDDFIITADKNRIEQVISNFISNGLKYAPNGKVLTIKAKQVSETMARVSVRDQGIGIPKDKADYIFDRFFRVEESSNMFSGLGLGLYISAEIIQRHNGRIGVESELNVGSEFWFEIPLQQS
jgi:two-component system CheB/CheR fusion protein